jgi:hypothetical protein
MRWNNEADIKVTTYALCLGNRTTSLHNSKLNPEYSVAKKEKLNNHLTTTTTLTEALKTNGTRRSSPSVKLSNNVSTS